ncbi:MAG: hypothetical protein PHS21_05550 [Atribacterota bacterium]|nr:hypothetical protein [Atribacterota bacterium]
MQVKDTQIQKEEDVFDQNLTETLKYTMLNSNKSDQEALYLELDGTSSTCKNRRRKRPASPEKR